MTALASEVQDLSEKLVAYQDVVGDVVSTLGHEGDSPEDLRDAVGQISERLLHGLDLDSPLTGTAEVIRILVIYAHFGAWMIQGLTREPILGEKASPELLALLNSMPPIERVGTLLRPCTPESLEYMRGFLEMFDRTKAMVEQ